MFADRLRSMRKARYITLQQMADKLGISLRGYAYYESGERFPSQETIVAIADILDCPIDFLLGRDKYLRSIGVTFENFL